MMKSVLLLGGLSDIGQALAREYGKKGWNVWIAARDIDKLGILKNDLIIRTENNNINTYPFDALDYSSHELFFDSLPACPDVVIVIFGLLGDQDEAFLHWDQAHAIIDTNYTGAVSVLNIAASKMKNAGRGTIIGISSVAGDRGRGSNFIYGSAKAGLSAYLSGLRNSMFKYGIHVMTVKPGFVNTRMTENLDLPGPLTAQPDEVAKRIISAAEKGRNTVYVRWIWRWIMLVIKLLPEFIFKRTKL